MSAHWKWGSVDIYVSEEDSEREVKRAEIFKLDNTESSFHYFGAASRKIKIKGIVVGVSNRNSIWSDAINDVSRTFTTPWESIVSAKINGTPKFTPIMYSSGTLDGVVYLSSVTPLYTVELEIIT